MAGSFTPRERRRLQQAHENGHLDATSRDNRTVVKAYGLWCWRLKVPMVWFERHSPRSRFGCVHLDMMTTPNMLTAAGQAALKALGATQASPHDGFWERIALTRLDKLAHAVFRAAVHGKNYRLNRAPLAKIDRRTSKPLKVVSRKAATA